MMAVAGAEGGLPGVLTDGDMPAEGDAGFGQKVLIGVDGSQMAEHALDWYINTIHHQGNTVLLVYIYDIPKFHSYQEMYVPPEVWQSSVQSETKKAADLERRLVGKLKKRKIRCKFITKEGKPASCLLAVAKDKDADMIIMGNKGHGALHRAIMGSVSTYVMHHAHCPVIVCKPKGMRTQQPRSRSSSESEVHAPRGRKKGVSESEAVPSQATQVRTEYEIGEMRARTGSGSLLRQVLMPKKKLR